VTVAHLVAMAALWRWVAAALMDRVSEKHAWGGGGCALGAGGGEGKSGTLTAAADLLIEEFPIVGQSHIPKGVPGGYTSNPPTSGGHFGSSRPWGVFGPPIADESAGHDIEHGDIWILYDPELGAASVRQLRDIAAQYPMQCACRRAPGPTAKFQSCHGAG